MCDKPNCKVKNPRYGVDKPTRCYKHRENLEELIHKIDTSKKCITCKKKRSIFNLEGKDAQYCGDCKTDNMINVRSKKCIKCKSREACFNLEGGRREYCSDCKTDNMINVKSKKCIKCGLKQPSFNLENKTALYCSDCKEDNMIDVRSLKCIICKLKGPSFNLIGESPRYCGDCKTNNMVNVTSKKCVICKLKIPSFNVKGKTAQYCGDCKEDNMIMITYKVCIICKKKRPNFNEEGEELALYCGDCKEDNMIDINHKKCIKCKKSRPSFNFEGKPAIYCSKCVDDKNMIDVVTRKCITCKNISASYGILGNKATHCYEHRQKNQIFKPNKKCITCKKEKAIYGYSTQLCCEKHKKDDMINIVERVCVSCQLPNILNKDGKCQSCDPANFNRIRLVKQNEVKDFLENSNYKYLTCDKIIDRGECIRYRPDFLFDCKTHYVILEVDEYQHKGYKDSCEFARMFNINQSVGMPVIFIRYNPDRYKSNRKTYDPTTFKRFAVLKNVLDITINYDVYETKLLLVNIAYIMIISILKIYH